MLASALSSFWPTWSRTKVAPPVLQKRPPPIFIGDAVQPFEGHTLLLSILRSDKEAPQGDDA